MTMEPVKPAYESYLTDESRIIGNAEYITFPETEMELSEVILRANEKNMKITFQGGNTGLTGGAVPGSGLIVNLSRMNKVAKIEENEGKATIRVGAGTTLEALERELNSKGYFFPVDPTEKTATLGGIYATGAAGPGRLKYGDMKKYVKALNMVTPKGELIHIERGNNVVVIEDGVRTVSIGENKGFKLLDLALPFSIEGNDLLDLLSGTEGYAGGITEFTLSVLKKPSDLWGVVFFFENERDALKFSEIVKDEDLTCLEFFDKETIKLLDNHSDSPLLKELPPFPEQISAAIYAEVSGDDSEKNTETLMNLLGKFSETGGKEENTWAENGFESVKKFRDMRHAVPSILSEDERITKGLIRFETDCEIFMDPLSLLDFYRSALSKKGLDGIIYGHILEGRLHVAFLPETEEERKKATEFIEEIFKKVFKANGYGISENGIGQTKRKLLLDSIDDETKKYLDGLRLVFDSEKIMNPKLEE